MFCCGAGGQPRQVVCAAQGLSLMCHVDISTVGRCIWVPAPLSLLTAMPAPCVAPLPDAAMWGSSGCRRLSASWQNLMASTSKYDGEPVWYSTRGASPCCSTQMLGRLHIVAACCCCVLLLLRQPCVRLHALRTRLYLIREMEKTWQGRGSSLQAHGIERGLPLVLACMQEPVHHRPLHQGRG